MIINIYFIYFGFKFITIKDVDFDKLYNTNIYDCHYTRDGHDILFKDIPSAEFICDFIMYLKLPSFKPDYMVILGVLQSKIHQCRYRSSNMYDIKLSAKRMHNKIELYIKNKLLEYVSLSDDYLYIGSYDYIIINDFLMNNNIKNIHITHMGRTAELIMDFGMLRYNELKHIIIIEEPKHIFIPHIDYKK